MCAANPVWADKNPLLDDDTDAMSDGVTDVFLLDHRQAQDLSYKYTKPIDMSEVAWRALWVASGYMLPRGPAW